MRFLDIIRMRLRSIFARASVERELDEELQYHLEREKEASVAAGRDARQAASGVTQRMEDCRDMRGLNVIDNLLRDIRFALRQLRKNTGFAVTAILMLALGIAASVSIFAFVDASLIKPLPYKDPERLVRLYAVTAQCPQCVMSYLNFVDWKKANKAFVALDAYRYLNFRISTPNGTQATVGYAVTDGFFKTLGVHPALGRDFYGGEDTPSANRVATLSYAAWQKRFDGKAEALGQSVTLNGNAHEIVGVMPQDFHFGPTSVEFFVSLHGGTSCESRRGCHSMGVVGRLPAGMSMDTALAESKVIASQLEQQYPDVNRGEGVALMSLREEMTGNIRPVLLALLAGAGLLLLIASVNIASLLLVRSEGRKREMAVRSALGASQGRIVHQFLTEAMVLVIFGSVVGLGLAWAAMILLVSLIPADMLAGMPYLAGLGLGGRVLAFAGFVALLALVLFAAAPTLRLSAKGISEGSRGSSGRAWRNLGSKLVVLELATAVVLLVGAGLLGKSLHKLLQVEIGLQPEHVVTLQFAAPRAYEPDKKAIALEREILSRVENLPGVKSAGMTSNLPLQAWDLATWINIVGQPVKSGHNEIPEREASSDYLATLGAKLIRGRYFTKAEDSSKPRIAIINQAFAKQYFAGQDPIGKQLTYESANPQVPLEIVGVIEDIKEGQLDSVNRPAMYVPLQHYVGSYYALVVRTSGAEQPLLSALTTTLHQIDPDITTKGAAKLKDLIDQSRAAYMHRSSAWLVGGFAALALLMSVVGLYGVVAYSVSQRTREIGVRMALGAAPGSVHQLVLREAAWLTAGGIGIGLVCAVAAAALIRGLLFGVETWDMPTLAGVAVVLGGSALLASYIPARRAASVNPVEALRAE